MDHFIAYTVTFSLILTTPRQKSAMIAPFIFSKPEGKRFTQKKTYLVKLDKFLYRDDSQETPLFIIKFYDYIT